MHPIFFFLIFTFFLIGSSSARCLGWCPPRFFCYATDFGGSEHSKEKYIKCTSCLGLVRALYPLELELPVISGLVLMSPFFSAWCKLSGAFMDVFV